MFTPLLPLRRLLLRCVLGALVGVVSLVVVSTSAEAMEELVSEGGHRILYEGWLAKDAERARAMLDGIQAEVEAKTGLAPGTKPAVIVIAGNLTTAREAARAAIPEWAAGVHVPARGRIVLRMDAIRGNAPARSLETVLRHEWVHLVLHRAATKAGRESSGRMLPLWAEEGLAEVLGGGISVDAGAALDNAAAFNHLIPFDQIEVSWPSTAARAGLAYRQGASWVRLYVERVGWENLAKLIAALRDDPRDLGKHRFGQLFLEVSGESLSQFDSRWRISLKLKARPWFHLFGRDFGTTVMLLLAVISMIAFAFVRRRRQRAIAALPDDRPWD